MRDLKQARLRARILSGRAAWYEEAPYRVCRPRDTRFSPAQFGSHHEPDQRGTAVFWLTSIFLMVLNAAIGYAVASPGDQAVEPLSMFPLAMGLHFLANDHALVEHHWERYQRDGR